MMRDGSLENKGAVPFSVKWIIMLKEHPGIILGIDQPVD